MSFSKTVASPDRGVDYGHDPALIDVRQWLTMQQLRARLGVVTNFPGWASILANGNLGGPATLLFEYVHLDQGTLLIAAGPSKVYIYHVVAKTLTDISGALTFATTLDDPWFPFQYGEVMYMTCRQHGLHGLLSGTVQKVIGATIAAGTRLQDGTVLTVDTIDTIPRGRSGAVLSDHICMLNTSEGGAVSFVWSQEGRNNVWTATPFNDAGDFPLNDTPDAGVALHRLGNDLIAYKDQTIIPITFIGGNEVFGRRQAISKIGLIGPYANLDRGDSHIFMGPDGFYQYFGGSRIEDTIGDSVNEFVWGELHPIYKNRSRTAWIRDTNEMLFFYPDKNSTGIANRCIIYNSLDKTWYGPFNIPTGVAMAVGRMKNPISKVIDEVLTIINNTPEIINYALYGTGNPLAIFADGVGIIQQFIGDSADGTAISRILETGDQSIGVNCQDEAGRNLSFPLGTVFDVQSLMIELGDVGASEDLLLQVGSRMVLNDDIVYTQQVIVKAHKGQQEVSNFGRASGRFFRLKITGPNNARIRLIAYQWIFSPHGSR